MGAPAIRGTVVIQPVPLATALLSGCLDLATPVALDEPIPIEFFAHLRVLGDFVLSDREADDAHGS